ncbi:MAG: acetolactate synthase large subunit [Caulobacter sp.]|nr:acetolactate synthase large subunit [Caulobacter sp.]
MSSDSPTRNGADLLLQTLVANGVTTCFANPGTSEMQFVAALDRAPDMRAVLCLFEGVATGAADGYARMSDSPAATLLHLGPGYLNGGANLHNARRARSPVVNVVGDHATYHRQFDAPLNSDIAGMSRPNSKWVGSAESPDDVSRLACEAVVTSRAKPAGPVTFILPADSAWLSTSTTPCVEALALPTAPSVDRIRALADRFRQSEAPVVLLGGDACDERALSAASRLARAGARIFTESFVARQRRGGDHFAPTRLAYFAEAAEAELAGTDLLLLVESQAPVAFFAYPGRASELTPDGCAVEVLASPAEDGAAALHALADALDAPAPQAMERDESVPQSPNGDLNAHLAGATIARHLPANAIISDDAVTAGQPIFDATRSAAAHDWLMLTGGAIGQGIPVAIGAAVACPDRKVISLNGDGAAMYTIQSLWTLARERLDVVVVVFANSAYRILGVEFTRTGSGDRPGPASQRLLDLGDPLIDWVALGQSMGVRSERCLTGEQFERAFAAAVGTPGPHLIEAVTGRAGRQAYGGSGAG